MRVLYVIDSIWGMGGAELCLLRMIRHLRQAGVECSVVTFHSAKFSQPLLDQFPCPVYHWQLKNVYDLNAFRVALRLSRFVRKQGIDIVHTFFPTADLWAAPVAKLSGAKVLISSRRDMGFTRSRKHDIAYRALRNIFDQVQAVSEAVRRYTIKTDGLDPANTITIHNGIETQTHPPAAGRDELRRRLGIDAGAPVITCVANFRPVKGIEVLIRAAAIVKRSAPDIRIVIAGHLGVKANLKYAGEVMALSKSLGLAGSALFPGQMEGVEDLLGLSDVFVLPSRTEGLSNALLEAMRAGLPCVATAVGGNPEVVEDGVSGFLVPSGDHVTMAARILTLVKDSKLREEMGRASRERILRSFSAEEMVARVLSAYETTLERKLSKGRLKNEGPVAVSDEPAPGKS